MSRSQQAEGEVVPGSRNLWLLDVATTQARRLTPSVKQQFDMLATWAPNGTAFVFEHSAARGKQAPRSTLQVMSPTSQRPKALVHGRGESSKPAWGPGNRVAFIAANAGVQCVAVIDAIGRRPRTLFCAPATAELARPQWSPDGTRLFVAGLLPEGRLEPIFHALAYRIDATTGSTTLLSDIEMFEPLQLTFSPDGNRGVYADIVASDMTLVDFGNGAITSLPRGHAPVFSPDGTRIAFTGEVFETGAEFRYYEPLMVMDADGNNVRRVTPDRVADHAYTTAQWSKDNVHLLANYRTFADPSLTRPNFQLRLVRTDTGAVKPLSEGYAEAGAWFEP
jgi:Tol biopolymer transport system component